MRRLLRARLYPTVRLQISTVSRPMPTEHRWPRASMRHRTTSEETLSSSVTPIVDPPSRRVTLASTAAVPSTLPGATLDFPTSVEIPATPLEAVTSVASPASTSVTSVVPASLALLASQEATVEALAIRLDSPTLAAAVSSSHPITRTLASARATAVMEESSVWVAVAADLALITN